MANFKVSIIEKVKLANGKWTNLPVRIPKSNPNVNHLNYGRHCPMMATGRMLKRNGRYSN